MEEVAIETVEIVSVEESAEPAMLTEFEVELLEKVGGGGYSWSF